MKKENVVRLIAENTRKGIIEEGSLSILALIAKDGASDCGVCMSLINGCSKNEKSCEEEGVEKIHEWVSQARKERKGKEGWIKNVNEHSHKQES